MSLFPGILNLLFCPVNLEFLKIPNPLDTAICEQCKSEIFDPFFEVLSLSFTVCTNCSPRYTTVRSLLMTEKHLNGRFSLCPECEKEYTDPLNQEGTCPACLLPKMRAGDLARTPRGMYWQKAINNCMCLGFPPARFYPCYKGFGGFHIACNARKEEPVKELRRR